MPIRPENLARYPKNWKTEIVPSIRRRSRGQCECTGQCGETHDGNLLGRCEAWNGEEHPITGSKVVLTVMHLDHQPEHCEPENLLHGCQKCHNRYDAPMRAAGRKARERAAMQITDLFE